MASEKEINEKIMTITMKIQKEYPELSKYLNELPVTIPIENDPEINIRVLIDYYESLVKLLSTYELEMAQKASQEK
ncbi:MAG: hypothetical protein H7250_08715 [Flavobacterium sp.]|nr:hypothetical protein [Flavobacterium sp.]